MDKFYTKENVQISTIDSVFGSIDSVECILAANKEMCWLKVDENLYFRNLIKNLIRFDTRQSKIYLRLCMIGDFVTIVSNKYCIL